MNPVLFYGRESCFSNFYPCTIQSDGHTFRSSEQYFMWRKAREFKDAEHEKLILDAKTPFAAKRLGRKIKPFDAARWDAISLDVMIDALTLKVAQNPHIAAALRDTGARPIAEASPRDTLWGIGLDETHPDAANPELWKGKNRLGKAWMAVRNL